MVEFKFGSMLYIVCCYVQSSTTRVYVYWLVKSSSCTKYRSRYTVRRSSSHRGLPLEVLKTERRASLHAKQGKAMPNNASLEIIDSLSTCIYQSDSLHAFIRVNATSPELAPPTHVALKLPVGQTALAARTHPSHRPFEMLIVAP